MIGMSRSVAYLVGVALAGYLVSAAVGDYQPDKAKDSKAAQLYVRLLGTSA
jgi:hypothetical protein